MSFFYQLSRHFRKQPAPALARLSYGQAFRHAAATPLTSLLLNLEMIKQHRALQQSAYLREAVQSAHYLKKLFRLEKSSHNQQRKPWFSVKLAIEAAVRLVRPLQKQVLIRSHFTFGNQLRIRGNCFCFQEAVICTLRNAIESYRSLQAISNRVVLINGRKIRADHQQSLKLCFIDGGCGLSWWQRPLIFAEGFTTKESGTGFGLVWVKRVVEDHLGGELKLKSQKGKGTQLTWILPLGQAD